ncbi:hypothetical protein LCGC14_0521160 [marine sediment metagenome]|uniref:Uncharacterized protein n=1 Tax=marine sediment metagenome TaxID=412755 RepID=A0A0F9V6N5_9ZZZZ
MPEQPTPEALAKTREGCPTCKGHILRCRLCGGYIADGDEGSWCPVILYDRKPHRVEPADCPECQRVAALITEGRDEGWNERDKAKDCPLCEEDLAKVKQRGWEEGARAERERLRTLWPELSEDEFIEALDAAPTETPWKCDQCGLTLAEWNVHNRGARRSIGDQCPLSHDPLGSCDGTLRGFAALDAAPEAKAD